MGKTATRLALGAFLVTAGLALASPANAQVLTQRWRNADTRNGTFFFGVSGGAKTNGFGKFWINGGTNIIIWPASGQDQQWTANLGGSGEVVNRFTDLSGSKMCLDINGRSTANGAQMVVQPCLSVGDNQQWQIKKAEDYGAPFPGCYVFINRLSGQVMGVSNGNVFKGASVIQWPLYQGNPWHPDQFWCPQF